MAAAASLTVAAGGMGSGYYSAEQIRSLQESAARQAALAEQERLRGELVPGTDLTKGLLVYRLPRRRCVRSVVSFISTVSCNLCKPRERLL